MDRDSEIVAPIFDERNAAVKKMTAQVISVCRTKGRKFGICGQAPSDFPVFAHHFVEQGIDSISLYLEIVRKTILAILEKETARTQAGGASSEDMGLDFWHEIEMISQVAV